VLLVFVSQLRLVEDHPIRPIFVQVVTIFNVVPALAVTLAVIFLILMQNNPVTHALLLRLLGIMVYQSADVK
jgi:hypothetical protein